jgi:hypothetical protein
VLANYVGDWERHGIYARVEEAQLQQLAQTVQRQPMDAVVIVVGDFNIPRGSRLYQDFLACSGLTDPLKGDTRPTLRLPSGVPSRFSLPIDYALVRLPDANIQWTASTRIIYLTITALRSVSPKMNLRKRSARHKHHAI